MSVIIPYVLTPPHSQNGVLWFFLNDGSPSQPSFTRVSASMSPFTAFQDSNCTGSGGNQQQYPECFDVDEDGCKILPVKS